MLKLMFENLLVQEWVGWVIHGYTHKSCKSIWPFSLRLIVLKSTCLRLMLLFCFFFYFLFFMRNVSCACALFTESINFFFLTKLSLKKGSTTLFTYLKKFCFGIFSFQQNKRYPNTPLVLSPSHKKKKKVLFSK